MPIPKDIFKTTAVARYETARAQIKSGDILLASGSAAFSKLIQGATGSIWSHVAFVLRVESIDRVMVLESVESIGVRTVALSSYLADYNGSGTGYPGRLLVARHDEFAIKGATLEALRAMSQFAVDLFGYPYDNDEIAKIAARIGLGGLGIQFDQAIQPDREFICSEYADRCYQQLDIHIAWDRRGFIAPANFADDEMVQPVCVLKS